MENVIIFDWDGVIVDSCSHYFKYYKETALHFGKIFPLKTEDEFREWYDSAWENNFINLGFDKEEVNIAKNYQLTLVNYDEIPFFSGIKETILTLKERYNLAIASTTHSIHILRKLKKEKMESIFSFISGGEGGTSDKKDIIKRVLDRFNVSPEKAVMVGDTTMDIISSKALNIKTIGVTYGWSPTHKIEKSKPDYLVHRPDDLSHTIEKIFLTTDVKKKNFY